TRKQITQLIFFFFQAEDGIRDRNVTGVQTCALPISLFPLILQAVKNPVVTVTAVPAGRMSGKSVIQTASHDRPMRASGRWASTKIGRASCRERVEMLEVDVAVESEKKDEGLDVMPAL